jgi:hypothetical protein
MDGPVDVNNRELLFATYPDGPVDANHREHQFVRMSGRKSEDCGHRVFLCCLDAAEYKSKFEQN